MPNEAMGALMGKIASWDVCAEGKGAQFLKPFIPSGMRFRAGDGKEMGKQIRLDDVLARYDTNFEDIKDAAVLDEWEIRAIEKGDFGRLRLSTSVKIAKAASVPEAQVEEAVDAIMLFLLDAASQQLESSC